MPPVNWPFPSTVRLFSVTFRPSAMSRSGEKLVEPVGRWITVDAPAPTRVTLLVTLNCPANVPAPMLIVLLPFAQFSAALIVLNGLACEAAAHVGFDVALAETYHCVVAACAGLAAMTGNATTTAPTSTPKRRRDAPNTMTSM